MTRVGVALLLAILASAMYLVAVQYESRRVFTELDKARSEARHLKTDFDRLQVEKRSQATPARVERLAREKLQMRQVSPGITNYLTPSGEVAMPAHISTSTTAVQP
ncbi:MAG: cell division protein FtsL [Methylotenera sp.]|jgi:cell division protein FtsL|nr:cell division protein FtsL [Methylotenera sp.]